MKYLILPIDDISAAIVTKAVNDADRANTIIDHRIAQEILRGRVAKFDDATILPIINDLLHAQTSGFTSQFIVIVDKIPTVEV